MKEYTFYYKTEEELKSILMELGAHINIENYSYTGTICPCIIEYDLSAGHTVDLKQVPYKKDIEVYVLNKDGSIANKIEYGKHKSKYRFSLSGSILSLPSYLKDTKVIIKYMKKNKKANRSEFPPCVCTLNAIDAVGNEVKISIRPEAK